MSTAPMSDPQTMPMDQLRQQVSAPSDPQPTPAPAVEPAPAAPAAPAPAPVPEPFSVQQDDSGITVQMGPEYGGEVFKGKDWAEIGPKIAKAKADANAYIKQLKATPATPQPTPATPEPPAVDPQDEAVRNWLLEQNAAALGITKEQYVQRMKLAFDSSEKVAIHASLAEFHQLCPDYTDTPENTEALKGYLSSLDHFPTAIELKNAYALALYEGKIQRGTAPQPGAPKLPPPMPGSTASPTSGGDNPWTMDKEALKRQAFGQ